MLSISALWTAWRNNFSIKGLILAWFAFIGGTYFLAPYILTLSWLTSGDLIKILIGEARVEKLKKNK